MVACYRRRHTWGEGGLVEDEPVDELHVVRRGPPEGMGIEFLERGPGRKSGRWDGLGGMGGGMGRLYAEFRVIWNPKDNIKCVEIH